MTYRYSRITVALLLFTLSYVNLSAQTWHKIYEPGVDLQSFVVAPATLTPTGPPGFAALNENVMACAHLRTYKDDASGKWFRGVIVLRSTNGGSTWNLIGEWKDWPWSTSKSDLTFHNISFTPDGSVFIKEGPHILKWDQVSGDWSEVWSTVATTHATYPVYAVAGTGDVLVLHSSQQAHRLEADGETFRPFFGTVALTPDSNLVVQSARLQVFKANALNPHVAYKSLLDMPLATMYSPVTGLLSNVNYVSPDGGQTWQALPSKPRLSGFENGIAISRNGVCYASKNDVDLSVSTNYGRSWQSANTTGLDGNSRSVKRSLDGKQVIIVTGSSSAYMATDSIIPAGLIWPPPSDTTQPTATTLVAPGDVNAGVEFEYSIDSTFSSFVNNVISANRHTRIEELNEFTTYYWRYRDVPPSGPKGSWGQTNSFRTTTSSYWRCVVFGGNSPASSWLGGATMDGTLYAARVNDTLLFHSKDRGLTFDTLTSLPGKITAFYETPQGVLHVRAGSWYRIEPTGTIMKVDPRPLSSIASTSYGHMFASSKDTLMLSKDDGRTWSKGRYFIEKITGMVVDGDDKLWIGAGYWENNNPMTGTRMVGGLRTMNSITGKFTQIAPSDLYHGDPEVRSYHSLCRQPNGTMYAYDTYGPLMSSPASGKIWKAVLSGDPNPQLDVLCLDNDGSVIVLPPDRKSIIRQKDSNSWRPLVAGLFPHEQPEYYMDKFQRVSHDGTIMAFGSDGVWILENPSISAGIAPLDRDTLLNTDGLIFRWPSTNNATAYLLQVSNSPLFKRLNEGDTVASFRALQVNSETTSNNYTLDHELQGGRYFWRTAALVEGAWQYAAVIHNFVVDRPVHVEDYNAEVDATACILSNSPNPASDWVTITSSLPINHVQLFTLDGQLAREQYCPGDKQVTFDVSQLTPGLYLLRTNSQVKNTQHLILVVH